LMALLSIPPFEVFFSGLIEITSRVVFGVITFTAFRLVIID